MPTTKSARDLVMKGNLAETVADLPGLAADGRMVLGSAGDDALDVARLAGGATREGWFLQGGAGTDMLTGSDGADILAVDGIDILGLPGPGETAAKLFVRKHPLSGGEPYTRQTAAGGGGDDLVIGGEGGDLLRGDAGDDVILGFGGDDMILGGTGNDWLDGGLGRNLLDGGAGIDTVSWAWIDGSNAPAGLPGVALNLSGQALQLRAEGGRILVQDLAGETVGAVGRMPNNKNPDLMKLADGEAGRAEQGLGRVDVEIDCVLGIERFEGTGRQTDIAILDTAFARGASDAGDGWTAYTDGVATLWLKGFESVLFA